VTASAGNTPEISPEEVSNPDKPLFPRKKRSEKREVGASESEVCLDHGPGSRSREGI